MTVINEKKIEKIATSFVNLISSFKERKMQRVLLSERLNKLDANTVAEVLHFFVLKSEENDYKFKPVMTCLIDIPFLVAALGNEKMSDIYDRLEERGYYNVRALMVSQPHKKRKIYEDDIIAFPDMEMITLGMKKTLAKSDKKHTLDKLVYEDNPIVIKNLLNNPRMTEKDVLKIITRRPLKKKILLEVINSKKWIDRYIIKKAIIRNPFTPTEIALNLLHFMLLQDLVQIAQDTRLHHSVRSTVKDMIEKKKNRYKKEEE
jgi:hypothetical protein